MPETQDVSQCTVRGFQAAEAEGRGPNSGSLLRAFGFRVRGSVRRNVEHYLATKHGPGSIQSKVCMLASFVLVFTASRFFEAFSKLAPHFLVIIALSPGRGRAFARRP